MTDQTLNNFKVYCVLIHRNLHILRKKLFDALFNGTILLFMQVLVFGYLFPLMGMPADYSAPLFIGTVVQMINNLFYNFGLVLVFDLNRNRFINYRISLPLPKSWLFASYITNNVIEGAVTTLPLMTLGIILLGPRFSIANTNWAGFIGMYLLALIFFSTAYLLTSFTIPFKKFMDNFWPLIGSPLMCSGSTFFTWKKLYAFAPSLATFLLLNPITYITEGLRSALLGGPDYIPLWICASVITSLILGMFVALSLSLNKRLDPV
jgi:ABC-2 type transport system permease protein